MKVLHFNSGDKTVSEAIEDFTQLRWIDFERTESLDFTALEKMLHQKHLKDLLNSKHPPYYEQTAAYEILIFRTIDERFEITEPKTRSTALIICQNTIISVHDHDDTTLSPLFDRWQSGELKSPGNVLSLLHTICDEIVEAFLKIREPMIQLATEWQTKLLDPNDPFDDWNIIMRAKSNLRSLSSNMALQKEVLISWREDTQQEFNAAQVIKFNDLNEHLARVERLADGLKSDLDALTQIYFASTSQRTNINVQILAVISAIFLPLNLIAGIFGMNFDHIPLMKHPLGLFIVIGLMLAVCIALLWWFKKKKWY